MQNMRTKKRGMGGLQISDLPGGGKRRLNWGFLPPFMERRKGRTPLQASQTCMCYLHVTLCLFETDKEGEEGRKRATPRNI